MEFRGSTNLYRKSGFGLHQLQTCLRGDFLLPADAPSRSAGILRKDLIRQYQPEKLLWMPCFGFVSGHDFSRALLDCVFVGSSPARFHAAALAPFS